MSVEEVIKDLKQQKFAPVYFLQGEEPYYIDWISNYIEEHALNPTEKSFNQVLLYGKDINVGVLLNYARRFPMMSQKQVVIVKEFQDMPDLNNAESQQLLSSYIQNPLPSTILVLNHKYKTFDKRKALGKILEQKAIVVESKKLYDNKIPAWIEQYVKEKAHQIKPQASFLLAEFVGADLSRIASEIDKILLNFQEKILIDEDIIQKFVGISKEYNVFELQKALGQKNIQKTFQIIKYFEANPKNNPIIPAIANIFHFFSKLLVVHATLDKSDSNLAKVLGINPFFVKDYTSALGHYPLTKIIAIIAYLRQADLRAKGVEAGEMGEMEILKELAYQILL